MRTNGNHSTSAETPFVSVAVITRNRAESLARTLQGLSRLDYPAYEVIVVDNGSTDNTAEIVAKYSARYVFSAPENGISLSRQLGIEAATGEIVAMCDDDCVPNPDWLQHIARRLSSEDDLALVGGHVVNIGFPGARQYKGRTKLGVNGTLAFVVDPREADFYGNLNMAVKREAVQSIGGYDPFLKAGLEEIDLAMNLRRHGFRTDYEPAAIVQHYFTGINFKRGRFFYDNYLMRLYFYFKHSRPKALAEWFRFLKIELRLLGRDMFKTMRAIAAAGLKWKPERLPALGLELFNLMSARAAIPWLLWRARRHGPAHKLAQVCPAR